MPQSGSDRKYYRIQTAEYSFILTENENIKENETFFYLAKHFKQLGIAVPQILAISNDKKIYLQQDLGDTSLSLKLEQEGFTNEVFHYFKLTIEELIKIQVLGHKNLDYNQCLTSKNFGQQAILADLLYFKYYFLDTLKIPYDKQLLLEEFEKLSQEILKTKFQYFMFRDFQSRNIMIHNNRPYFIDFQGGMQGAVQYDIGSLLWQAKANLPLQWKQDLLDYYILKLQETLAITIEKEIFLFDYNSYVMLRLLQVLGAYGFRGLFERKAHFLTSIPMALKNLKSFLTNQYFYQSYRVLTHILEQISSESIINKFTVKKADSETKLKIEINSFSFARGYPQANPVFGGGFVFDMRGIYNPGRKPEFCYLNGKDKEIKVFLEEKTLMTEFLCNIWDALDKSIQNYMSRNFEYLQINFGCTGGQHRSVYAAEETARHIRNKYNLPIKLQHLNEKNWPIKNKNLN